MPPKRPYGSVFKISTPEQMFQGRAPVVEGGDAANTNRLRKFRAKKEAERNVEIPQFAAEEIQLRHKAKLRIPPDNLCHVLWPGKANDQPPVFLLTPHGAQNLGEVLACLQNWGEYFGAVQLRFPPEFASLKTGAPETWFPKTKAGKYAVHRPTYVRQENVLDLGSESGVATNQFRKLKGQKLPPCSSILAAINNASALYFTTTMSPKTFWDNLKAGIIMNPVHRIDINAKAFQELHSRSALRMAQGEFNLLSADKWVNAKTLEGYQESVFNLGQAATVSSWHVEDFLVHAVNYQHFGAPNIWYTVPMAYIRNFETAIRDDMSQWNDKMLATRDTTCSQFIRHLGLIHNERGLPLNLEAGKKKLWRAFRFEQQPGDMIVTWPGVYHSGFNTGFNVNEAGAIALKNWVKGGKKFRPCTCECEGKREIDWTVIEKYL